MSGGYCVQCGSSIPKSQRTCSMCYGDIGHGTDGYYRRWAEDEMRREDEREREQDGSGSQGREHP